MNALYNLTDLNNQTVWINLQAVTAIAIPSPLDPKNVQSQILVGPVGFIVSEAEARKLLHTFDLDTTP